MAWSCRETRPGWAVTLMVVGLALAVGSLVSPAKVNVRVAWATGSELDTAGFHVYRATAPGGPYTRLTPRLLSAAPDPVMGGEHAFVDSDVVVGATYYYQIEDVGLDGAGTRHGPVIATARAPVNTWLWLGLAIAGVGLLWLARAMAVRCWTRDRVGVGSA